MPIIAGFAHLGFQILATKVRRKRIKAAGLSVEKVNKISQGSPHLLDRIKAGEIQFVINTLTGGPGEPVRDVVPDPAGGGGAWRTCLTSLDTAGAMLKVMQSLMTGTTCGCDPAARVRGALKTGGRLACWKQKIV